jgi:hypothetical protein
MSDDNVVSLVSSLWPTLRHHRYPVQYHHPASLMKLGILVIRNMMHGGRLLEGKHLMDNEDWLLS